MMKPLTLIQRAQHAIKATQMVFSRGYSGWGRFDNLTDPWRDGCQWMRSDGGTYDPVAAAGDVSLNAVVAICTAWVAEEIRQAKLQVLEENSEGVGTPVAKHAIPALIRRPNGYYGQAELLGATASDYLIDGNALWLKIRDRGGAVSELWWVPRQMWSCEGDDETFVSRYIYSVDGRKLVWGPNDVVHHRFPKLDPTNPRLGISPLKALLREIGLDNGITTVNGALVSQGGMPGVIIAPKMREGDPPMTEDDAGKIRATHQRLFAGAGAGRVMVLTFDATLQKNTFSPEEMKLDVIGHRPEARICAAMRIQASAVGLSVGEAQRTYANLKEAREASWEECLIPMNAGLADGMDRQLLPDFEGTESGHRVGWDYSEVRALREDEDAKSKRAIAEWEADGLTYDEFRGKIGQGKVGPPRGDMFFSELGMQKAQAIAEVTQPAEAPVDSSGDANAQNGNGNGATRRPFQPSGKALVPAGLDEEAEPGDA